MMGLDLSHGDFCWSYSAVNDWRMELFRAAGIEFDADGESFIMDDEDILYVLLLHSDCDGEISSKDCLPLADRIEELLPKMQKRQNMSKDFIESLREASENGDNLEFL